MDFDFSSLGDCVITEQCFKHILDFEINKARRYLYYFSLLRIEPDVTPEATNTLDQELYKPLNNLINKSIRTSDITGRRTKNQFFLIVHQSSPKDLKIVCERILEHVNSFNFNIPSNENNITVSTGAACFPTSCNHLDSLLEKSSEALSKAQKNGGNCYFISE